MYCLSIRRERLLRSPLPKLPWEAWYSLDYKMFEGVRSLFKNGQNLYEPGVDKTRSGIGQLG